VSAALSGNNVSAVTLAAAAINSRLGSPSQPGGLARNRSMGEVEKFLAFIDSWLNLFREIGIGAVEFALGLGLFAAGSAEISLDWSGLSVNISSRFCR